MYTVSLLCLLMPPMQHNALLLFLLQFLRVSLIYQQKQCTSSYTPGEKILLLLLNKIKIVRCYCIYMYMYM